MVPPRSQTLGKPQEEWIQIGKKGKKKKPETSKAAIKREKRRLPTISAISIKDSEKNFSYAEASKRVRSEISLTDLDIQAPKIRKGMSGSTIIEIAGPNCSEKTDKLAAEVQKLLHDEAHITRPSIKGEIRLFGMDESVDVEEIREAVNREAPVRWKKSKSEKSEERGVVRVSFGYNVPK